MKHFITTIFIILIFASAISAQEIKEEWVRVNIDGQELYINSHGLDRYKGDDVYVWTLEEFKIPIIIEIVKDKIYKTRTLYLFNNKLKRYSILEVIYYDKNNNVLNSFSYQRNTDIKDYKYNYPIIPNSVEDKIFHKTMEFTGDKNSE